MATQRYNPESVVDYLSSEGKDASFAARQQLAKDLGIQGYSGSAAQNTELLTKSKAQKQFGNDALQTPEVAGTVKPSPLLPDGSNYGRGGGIAYGTDDQNRIRRYEGAPTTAPTPTTTAPKSGDVDQYGRTYDASTGQWTKVDNKYWQQPDGLKADAGTKIRYASTYESALNSLDGGMPQSLSASEEEALREKTRKQFQDQIDAINAVYDGIIKQREIVNTNQLGRARATNARGGLIGSDFGNSAIGNVEAQNQEALAAINSERGAKIAAMMGAKNAAEQEAIEKRKAELDREQEKYLSRKKEVQDSVAAKQKEARQRLIQLAKANLPMEGDAVTLFSQLVEESGLSELEADALMKSAADESVDPIEVDGNLVLFDQNTGEWKTVWSKNAGGSTGENVKFIPATKYQPAGYFNSQTNEFTPIKNQSTSTSGGTGGGTKKKVKLTAAQQGKVDAINSVVGQLENYKKLLDKTTSEKGFNLTGQDAAELRTAKSALEFAVATAVGTGALQAADRAVVQDIIPDPTTLSGAFGGAVRGGKAGMLLSLDQAKKIFEANRFSIEQGESVSPDNSPDVLVEDDGYDSYLESIGE